MLIQPGVLDLVENHQDLNGVILDEKSDRGISGLFRLAVKLRKERFEAAILLHPTLRLAVAMFMAGIPLRIGTGYRFYSFLLNKRIYEHRKYSKRHEAEYNLSLAAAIDADVKPVKFNLPVSEKARETVFRLLHRTGISEKDRYVVIHPGSRGSALDWPPERFFQLGERISMSLKHPLIVTGSERENNELSVLVNQYATSIVSFMGRLSLKELIALLASADLVIANSTGPLHLAAATGTSVIGFFPPFRAASARRWGPYGQEDSVLVPPLAECVRCQGPKCDHWNCMSLIQVEEVFQMVKKKLCYEDEYV